MRHRTWWIGLGLMLLSFGSGCRLMCERYCERHPPQPQQPYPCQPGCHYPPAPNCYCPPGQAGYSYSQPAWQPPPPAPHCP